MSSILVPNTVLVELIFVQYQQRMENTFHVKCSGVPSDADLLAIKGIFQLWDRGVTVVSTHLAYHRANNASLVQISCTSLHSVGGPVLDYVLPTQSNGVPSVNYPSYFTIAVKWLTGLAGRSRRGRTYHVGPAVMVDSTGLWTVAQASLLQTCYAKLITDLSAAGYTLVVASKYSGVQIINGYRRGIPRSVGITTTITGVGVERGMDTMRKRKIPHIA